MRPPGRVREDAETVRVTADGSALVSGDAEALGRVVRSLLDNAFRHGKPPVGITIGRRDGRIQLEVSDAGPGFPTGTEERIFERFYRADPARTGEGTGLGLSISYGIIQRHGGSITVSSKVGSGTTFTVRIPICAAGIETEQQ